MMKKICTVCSGNCFGNPDTALLILRLVLGAIFIPHGLAKFVHSEPTVAFFAQLGLHSSWAYLSASAEVVAGTALLLGIFTRWAGILLAIDMAAAFWFFGMNAGFFAEGQLNFLLFFLSVAAILGGPGAYRLIPCRCLCMHGKENT